MLIRKIGIIGRTYRHIKRYRQILTVLFRHGFGEIVDALRIEHYLDVGLQMISRRRRERIEKLSRAARVRLAIEELGPTFIKLGQILSTRPNLFPAEFLRELEKLQDEVPPFAFDEARAILEEELGAELEECFESFEEQPLAAASLGQVHRARLPGGEEVVVKVQRPQIRQIIAVDLEIMLHLAALMEKHIEGWKIHQPTRLVEEFGRTLERELDYTIEAAHIERFARLFAQESDLYVPTIYRERTTRRVLTMEYVEGVKASDLAGLEALGLDRRELARRGASLLMKQIFVHGFFHADPHPGNILFLPEHVICFLDFGMVGRLERRRREDFADLLLAIARTDEEKAAGALLKLSSGEKVREQPLDGATLRREVGEFMDQHFHRPLKELELGRLLQELLAILARHRLNIAPDLFLLIKALSTTEGLGHTLDPDFDLVAQAEPFVRRIHRSRYDPRRISADLIESGGELLHLLQEIPREMRAILEQVRRGRIGIEFKHQGLEPLISTYDRVSNRIAFALVLGSLIVGSALIILSGLPPKWHEIPVIGLVGFLIAGAMGFWLLLSILKHGRM